MSFWNTSNAKIAVELQRTVQYVTWTSLYTILKQGKLMKFYTKLLQIVALLMLTTAPIVVALSNICWKC